MNQPVGFDPTTQVPTPDFPPMTEPMVRAMLAIGPWARFFSILGIIFTVLGAMGGLILIAMGIAGVSMPRDMGGREIEFIPMIGLTVLGLLYLVMTLLYVFPVIFLFKTANGVARMKRGEMVGGIEHALTNQKSLYKYFGILTIVMLCLYPVFIIVIVVAALASSMPS